MTKETLILSLGNKVTQDKILRLLPLLNKKMPNGKGEEDNLLGLCYWHDYTLSHIASSLMGDKWAK